MLRKFRELPFGQQWAFIAIAIIATIAITGVLFSTTRTDPPSIPHRVRYVPNWL